MMQNLNISINFFSILIVIYCIYVLIRFKTISHQYIRFIAVAFILEVGKFQGYFLAIGSSEVSYEDAFVTILFIINFITIVKQKRYNKKTFIAALSLLFIAILGIIMENIVPYQGLIIPYNSIYAWDGYAIEIEEKTRFVYSIARFVLFYVRLLSLTTTTLVIHKELTVNCYKKTISIISNFGKIILSYGIVELVAKNIFYSSLTSTINCMIFGLGSSTYTALSFRLGLARLQGFTREPSHFSMTIFYFILIIIMNDVIGCTSKRKFWVPIATLLLLMSRSFAALVYLILVFVFVFTFYGKGVADIIKIKKRLWIFGISAIAGIVVLLLCGIESYLTNRLAYIIHVIGVIITGNWRGKIPVNSDVVRLVSTIETIKDFLHRPFLGLGMGVESAHSGVANMLVDIGILGVWFWWKLIASIAHDKRGKIIVLVWILAANLFCGTQRIMYSVVTVVFIVFCECTDSQYVDNVLENLGKERG